MLIPICRASSLSPSCMSWCIVCIERRSIGLPTFTGRAPAYVGPVYITSLLSTGFLRGVLSMVFHRYGFVSFLSPVVLASRLSLS